LNQISKKKYFRELRKIFKYEISQIIQKIIKITLAEKEELFKWKKIKYKRI